MNLTPCDRLPNVSRDVWTAAVVWTVYRLRWQIELTFKHWKALLHLHVLKGTRPERIKCLLYSRLITIVLLSMISAYAAWYASNCLQRAMRIHKLIETWS